ncbi:hypothetical protein AK88_01605 [Plasmodium fragile]|uniref:DNA2/NAM7 helicase-like C-terminal domain-containing protein n=1 Tax=Plasmodium fragile TaxID=5857 RepID=A0A0D9QNV3_PLAFR|nr:uncharacterized protein AK88_01605 [Plasmodium fragile]KJP88724.1 hypothetical protein AK88_01605 [Plasmodium fragile]
MKPYSIKRTYECLYTHQKTQKSKKWQEGYCEIIASYGVIKMNLLNQNRSCIETSLSCEAAFNNIEEEIELPKHLIQFVDMTNYDEDIITNETSKKRRHLSSTRNEESVHANKNKKITAHSGIKNSRESIGWEAPTVDNQTDSTSLTVRTTDRYMCTNRDFERPRRIGKHVHVDKDEDLHGEATQHVDADNSVADSSEGEYQDRGKKKKNSMHTIASRNVSNTSEDKERISVTYTNIRTFNTNKKNVKWYDGFLVKKNDLLELYNDSGGRLYVRSTDENMQQQEYVQFGGYIVYNDFSVHLAQHQQVNAGTNVGRTSDMLKGASLVHGARIPAQLHQMPGRKGDSEGDTNADEEEETNEEADPGSDNNYRVDSTASIKRRANQNPDAEAVSLFNKHTEGNEWPSCPSEANRSHMDTSPITKEQLRTDDHGGDSDSIGEGCCQDRQVHHHRGRCEAGRCQAGGDEPGDDQPGGRRRWKRVEVPLYKNPKGRSAAYVCSSCRHKINTYEEIINIAKVVSENNFAWVNPRRNVIRLTLGIKLLSRRVRKGLPPRPPPSGGNSGHHRDCDRRPFWGDRNGETQPFSSDRNGQMRPTWGDRYGDKQQPYGHDRVRDKQTYRHDRVGEDSAHDRDGDKRPYGSSTEANSNGEEPGEAATSEVEWDAKNQQHVEMIRDVSFETNYQEEIHKVESSATIEGPHLNPYEIKSLKNFACTNSGFNASQVDQVCRQNLFLPMHISILKEKDDMKKKVKSIKFQSIPNFFINKLEYIQSFMNATLFHIYYQVQCKLLCLHDYLVPLLDEMRGDYVRVGRSLRHSSMLEMVNYMKGHFVDSRSDEDLPTVSRHLQTNHPNEEGNKKKKKYHLDDDYTLVIRNIEVLCSSEEETTNMFGDNKNQDRVSHCFVSESDTKPKRFFIRRTEKDVLLVNKKKTNKLTKEEDINKYVHMNHLIVMSRGMSSSPSPSPAWVKDQHLLLFVAKWSNFKQNYLEIYPLNVNTFSYMNEAFHAVQSVKSKEFLYFLKSYKVKSFSSCLFLVNLGDHLDNLKHLFFFHQNLEKGMVPLSKLFSPPYVNKSDTLQVDGLLQQIGIRTSAWGSSSDLIDLHNVGVDYMDDLLSRLRNDRQLNQRQKWVIECILAWFRCGTEKKCDQSETTSSAGEPSEDELPPPTCDDTRTATHRGDSILVNGIFGSGKSTLICNAIWYLDQVLTHEEKAAKAAKAKRGQTIDQGIEERSGHNGASDGSDGDEENHLGETSPPLLTQMDHRKPSQYKKKILLMCNTNLAVDNILLKLKFHFDFHDYARIGNIFEINFFLITNFISINSNEERKAIEVKNYVQSLSRSAKCTPTISSDPSLSESVSPTRAEPKLHKIKDMDKLIEALMKRNNFVFRNKYRNKRVIAGTCKSLQIYEKLTTIKKSIDYLIVDECTQIDELTLFQFLLKFEIRKFLLIGDVKQLGVVLKSPSDLKRSMFSRLVENELFIKHHLAGIGVVTRDQGSNKRGSRIAEDAEGTEEGPIDRIVHRVRSMRAAEYSALRSYLYDNMFALHGGDNHTYEGEDMNEENPSPRTTLCTETSMQRVVAPRAGINHLILMNEQFRCHPEISSICSHLFYNGLIKNALCTETIPLMYKRYESHVNFILLKNAPREMTFQSTFTNGEEAKIILALCEKMVGSSSIDPEQIGIISLFKNQAFYIKNKMKQSPYYERLRNVKVNTVDSFQGIEKDIILFSCVLGEVNGVSKLERVRHDHTTDWRDDSFHAFCNNRNRINVALSRARSQLIIVAQSSFVESNRVWSYIKSRAKVYHYD